MGVRDQVRKGVKEVLQKLKAWELKIWSYFPVITKEQ